MIRITAVDGLGLIPDDLYPAVITSAQVVNAKSGTSQNLILEFEITGPGETGYDAGGRTLRSWNNLSRRMQWKTYRWATRLGLISEGEDLVIEDDPATGVVLSPEFVGQACWIRVRTTNGYTEVEDLFGTEHGGE